MIFREFEDLKAMRWLSIQCPEQLNFSVLMFFCFFTEYGFIIVQRKEYCYTKYVLLVTGVPIFVILGGPNKSL